MNNIDLFIKVSDENIIDFNGESMEQPRNIFDEKLLSNEFTMNKNISNEAEIKISGVVS